LTIHIEADTFPELMDALDAVMGELNPRGFTLPAGVVATEQDDKLRYDAPVVALTSATDAEAEADAVTTEGDKPKRTRTTKPKVDADPAPAATETVDTTVAPPAVVNAAAENDLSALSPADARAKGISLVQKAYAADPSLLDKVQALAGRMGVSHFDKLPDDKAHLFLAEAMLLADGKVAA